MLGMTFSEFGRTIYENGSAGTDHGTGAPIMLFGKGLGKGIVGQPPDLINTDQYGDPLLRRISEMYMQPYFKVGWACLQKYQISSLAKTEHLFQV
ncbi:MAG: DUF1501 domain-containing protein [Saprospiraceae bacterium]|nr:DUF1501 domain-containing protein [Saprospiraceae bacterium]